MKASDILHKKVISESGKDFGPVLTILAEQVGKGRPKDLVIAKLICGSQGFLQRLGMTKINTLEIPWGAVLKVEEKQIIIVDPFKNL